MDEKPVHESDSGRQPSDEEKKVGLDLHGQIEDAIAHDQLPPDPDAHLSEEERAAIVCFYS